MAIHSLSCAQIDDTFLPHALYCRGGFDFTLLFEETILTLLPLALFLIVAPFRIWYLFKKEAKVIHSSLLPIKIVSASQIMFPGFDYSTYSFSLTRLFL